jgi:acyl-CoA oxidase
MLLPGINIGDIGKKMGRDGIDNGFIQFTFVRVPRSHMLMKHTQGPSVLLILFARIIS